MFHFFQPRFPSKSKILVGLFGMVKTCDFTWPRPPQVCLGDTSWRIKKFGPGADRYKWSFTWVAPINGRKYMGNWCYGAPISGVIYFTLLIYDRGPPCRYFHLSIVSFSCSTYVIFCKECIIWWCYQGAPMKGDMEKKTTSRWFRVTPGDSEWPFWDG